MMGSHDERHFNLPSERSRQWGLCRDSSAVLVGLSAKAVETFQVEIERSNHVGGDRAGRRKRDDGGKDRGGDGRRGKRGDGLGVKVGMG